MLQVESSVEGNVGGESTTSWKGVHAALTRLARRKAAHDHEEGQWLLAGLRARVFLHLGYGSFIEYVERLFGYGPRETNERLRVAECLEALPKLANALATGALSWSAARELTRVAVAETEAAWLDAAEGCTVRQIESKVSGRKMGDLPSTPADAAARRHVLRFEVTGDTFALWREAIAELRRRSGPMDEDDALLEMARLVLSGPSDDGRASYQVAMTVCQSCGQGQMEGRGENVSVDRAVVEMAECDAQRLGSLKTHVGAEGATHVEATQVRASQSVPPRTRRFVLHRDHGQCVVPGCRAATFVDVHHLDLRSEGGGHEPERLVTLCGAHHRASHRGQLHIAGRAPDALSFRHADGSVYGRAVDDPETIEVFEQTFSALRTLGFPERAARRALRIARQTLDTHVGAPLERGAHSVETLLRGALAVLT